MEYQATSEAFAIMGLYGGGSATYTVMNMPHTSQRSCMVSHNAVGASGDADAGSRMNYCDYSTTEAHNAVKFDYQDTSFDLAYVVFKQSS